MLHSAKSYHSTHGMWEITHWRATCSETANSGVMLSEKECPVTSFCSLSQQPMKRGCQSRCRTCLPTLLKSICEQFCSVTNAMAAGYRETAQLQGTPCLGLRPESGFQGMKSLLTSTLWTVSVKASIQRALTSVWTNSAWL